MFNGDKYDWKEESVKDQTSKESTQINNGSRETKQTSSQAIKNKVLYKLNSFRFQFKFGWVLWHINHFGLFNAKSSLYIYIEYIEFGLVGFYGISTIVGYLMPNPLYKYIRYI